MMSLFTRRKAIGLFRLVGLAVPFKFSPLLAAETQAATNTPDVHLLSQDARPPPSVPLQDARLCAPASDRPRSDSKLPNVNWVRGNEARAEWTWAAQLADNPEAVPNNLGRYLVQIPGVLEKQLDYSTTLIFDTPSFRNGVQISGFVDRVTKELVTNAIAQRRRAWYTMTHHAFLGMQSALRYGAAPDKMAQKMLHLDAPSTPGIFDRHERAALIFANKFATDPQSYSDQDFAEFRAAFGEYDQNVYASVERPFLQLRAAREARAQALVDGKSANEADTLARKAADSVPTTMPKDLLARKINSQFVELCFLGMQFVALTGVFSALNIPDEGPMDGALQPAYPPEFIKKLNGLLAAGSNGIGEIVPPAVIPPTEAIAAGRVKVGPAPLKGARIPLASYELNPDRDFGITQGGQSLAAWGWGRGAHLPGSLVSALEYLPDAGHEEALYSLALMFNEDQTRNGVLVAGFVDRVLKELLVQKVYRLSRSRYGLEHHTVFTYGEFLRRYSGGGYRRPGMSDADARRSERALKECTEKLLYLHEANKHPEKYSPVELAAFAWVDAVILKPHEAYRLEPALRQALKNQDEAEIAAGTRWLDMAGDVTRGDAINRLLDHQIAELAMFVAHMDGIGRAMTMMQLEVEEPVQIIRGRVGPSGGIVPELDKDGQVIPTGYFNNRPGFHALMRGVGVDERIMTLNELFANPKLNLEITRRLEAGQKSVSISGEDAAKTGEF